MKEKEIKKFDVRISKFCQYCVFTSQQKTPTKYAKHFHMRKFFSHEH